MHVFWQLRNKYVYDWDCPDTFKAPFYQGLERNAYTLSPILWLGVGFLENQAWDCASGMPILSHIPKTGYKLMVLSNLKNKSLF